MEQQSSCHNPSRQLGRNELISKRLYLIVSCCLLHMNDLHVGDVDVVVQVLVSINCK